MERIPQLCSEYQKLKIDSSVDYSSEYAERDEDYAQRVFSYRNLHPSIKLHTWAINETEFRRYV